MSIILSSAWVVIPCYAAPFVLVPLFKLLSSCLSSYLVVVVDIPPGGTLAPKILLLAFLGEKCVLLWLVRARALEWLLLPKLGGICGYCCYLRWTRLESESKAVRWRNCR